MDILELEEIAIILGVATTILLLASRIRLPSIVAFLFTGMLVGPYGLKLVKASHVELIATLGIILLLFSIGIEFSVRKLMSMKRLFFVGGSLQMFLTLFVGFLAAVVIGRPYGEALFLGAMLSLSSTAIVMKTLSERHEMDAPHGRLSVAIMIFQDVMSIPLLLMVPLFAGIKEEGVEPGYLLALFKGLTIIIVIYLLSQFVIPKLMFQITKTKRRELFFLSILTICFSVALGTTYLGLPISLGAFLAGLTVSESEYRHQAIGDILPFQEAFTSFFFVSVGMLLDINFMLSHPMLIGLISLGVILMKSVIGTVVGLVLKFPLRSSIFAGLFICQIGEFSFVLAEAGRRFDLGGDFHYQLFYSVSLVTMALSPYLIRADHKIAHLFHKLPIPERFKLGVVPHSDNKEGLDNHVVIIGFGVCGKTIAKSCKYAHIPYVVIEMNPVTVKEEKARGEPIFFGDAIHDIVLRHAEVEKAKVAVICINDMATARKVIENIRVNNSSIYIITRAHYLQESHDLHLSGSNQVVTDEFESSIEIFTSVLKKFHTSKEEIGRYSSFVRSKNYHFEVYE